MNMCVRMNDDGAQRMMDPSSVTWPNGPGRFGTLAESKGAGKTGNREKTNFLLIENWAVGAEIFKDHVKKKKRRKSVVRFCGGTSSWMEI